jgi:hypothetical protein
VGYVPATSPPARSYMLLTFCECVANVLLSLTGMCQKRALQRARQVRDNDVITVGDLREVAQALAEYGKYDPFHPPILACDVVD